MSRRVSLPDFLGEEDSDINALFSDENETDKYSKRANVKRVLLRVIENELTERQKQIINLYYFKQQYDSEVKKREQKEMESRRKFNLFNKKEIEKATKHINDEMNEAAEEFYKTKKDDGLER